MSNYVHYDTKAAIDASCKSYVEEVDKALEKCPGGADLDFILCQKELRVAFFEVDAALLNLLNKGHSREMAYRALAVVIGTQVGGGIKNAGEEFMRGVSTAALLTLNPDAAGIKHGSLLVEPVEGGHA